MRHVEYGRLYLTHHKNLLRNSHLHSSVCSEFVWTKSNIKAFNKSVSRKITLGIQNPELTLYQQKVAHQRKYCISDTNKRVTNRSVDNIEMSSMIFKNDQNLGLLIILITRCLHKQKYTVYISTRWKSVISFALSMK